MSEVIPFTHHGSLGPLIIDNKPKPLPQMKTVTMQSLQKTIASLQHELEKVKKENTHLKDWDETRKRLDAADNPFCHHNQRYTYTHDGGKTNFCMECQRDSLKAGLSRLRSEV